MSTVLALLLAVPVTAASIAISLAISVPLTGVLIRYRADYTPKTIRLSDDENDSQALYPYRSYFGTMRRVYRLEGWAGLYRGIIPAILSSVLVAAALVPLVLLTLKGAVDMTTDLLSEFIGTLVGSFIGLPILILTDRIITTPKRLPYFHLKQSLRALLTPAERRRPLILYLTPGLVVAQFLQILLGFMLRYLTLVIVKALAPNNSGVHIIYANPIRLVISLVFVLIATALFTPLQVITVRLAIQRNRGSLTRGSVMLAETHVEDTDDELPDFSTEDVIGLRSEDDPYVGFIDCANKIIREEGWRVLYRAWWVTLLSGIAGYTIGLFSTL